MTKGLVSVVLPIYKVENYLERCINSIVMQSYSNLEIILVDDGSPDNCPNICDEWARKDKRIKVIHKKNAGLGMARNTGIENATGEYICFFDSDDYIALETIEQAYLLAKSTKADIVTFGHGIIDKNGRVKYSAIPKMGKNVYVGNEVQEVFLPDLIAIDPKTGNATNLSMSAWASFYSMALINRTGWRFVSEREIISEDIYSLLRLYKCVERVAVLPLELYYYCENGASLSRTYRKDRFEKICYFYKKCSEAHQELGYNKEVALRLSKTFLSFSVGAMKMIVGANVGISEKKLEVRNILENACLQRVLREVDISRETLKRRMLFIAMRKKWHRITYTLVHMKVKSDF